MSYLTDEETTSLTVKRWQRDGQDRVYVNAPDGTKLGWIDLFTGARLIEPAGEREMVCNAMDEWMRGHDRPDTRPCAAAEAPDDSAGSPSGQSGEPAEPGVSTGQTDLAANPPGKTARARVIDARRERPVASWFARRLGVHNEERAWRMAEKGALLVAAELATLGEAWRILHAVPVGKKEDDIDHLVVGPAGVFSLSSRHHPGGSIWVDGNTFMVRGQRQPYVWKSRREATSVARILSTACGFPVAVTGTIVVVNAQSMHVKHQPDDVYVIAVRRLQRWLLSRPSTLDGASVDRIFAVARESSTWVTSELTASPQARQ